MLREEVKQVEQIANDIATRSISAAVAILSAKIAELEVRVNRISEARKPLKKTEE